MNYPITPLYPYILVTIPEEEKISEGGFILPDKKERPSKGIVVAVPRVTKPDDFIGVEVGDTVFFPKYTTEELIVDDVVHLSVKYWNLIAVKRPDPRKMTEAERNAIR